MGFSRGGRRVYERACASRLHPKESKAWPSEKPTRIFASPRRNAASKFADECYSAAVFGALRAVAFFLGAGFLAAGFFAAAFFGAARFLPAGRAAISSMASSRVTASGAISLGRVALTFSHLT